MKTLLALIAAIAVVGGVYLWISKKNNTDSEKESGTSTDNNSTELNQVKNDVSQQIIQRHSEAAEIIKESIENINDNEDERITKNEDIKKKMFNDIDNI